MITVVYGGVAGVGEAAASSPQRYLNTMGQTCRSDCRGLQQIRLEHQFSTELAGSPGGAPFTYLLSKARKFK